MSAVIGELFSSDELKKFDYLRENKIEVINSELKSLIKDFNEKNIDIKKIKNSFEYRWICKKYFSYMGMKYIESEFTEILGNALEYKTIINKVKLGEVRRFLLSVGYIKEEEIEIEINFGNQNRIEYKIESGIEKFFSISFKAEDIKILSCEYGNHEFINDYKIEQGNKKTLRFHIKILPGKWVDLVEKINIATNKGNYIYEIYIEGKYSRKIEEKDKWIYNYLLNKEDEEIFKEKFEGELRERLLELREYKYLGIYDKAFEISEEHGVSQFEIFEYLRKEDINSISINDEILEEKKIPFIQKISRIFYMGNNKEWQGIEKFVNENVSETGSFKNNNVIKDARYISFRKNIINYINNNVKEGKIKLIRGNVKKYLENIRIPDEFIYFIVDNLEKFNLDPIVEEAIKLRIQNLLIYSMEYTIKKEKLKGIATKVFKKEDKYFKFVSEKIESLLEVEFEVGKEKILLENKLLESKYILEGFFFSEVKNYIFMPYGINEISLLNDKQNLIKIEQDKFIECFDCIEKDILENYNGESVYRIIIFNKIYRYLMDKKYSQMPLDEELEKFILRQENDFKKIYNKLKEKDINKTKREIFFENLTNREKLIKIIELCKDGEELFKAIDGYEKIEENKIKERGLYIEIYLRIMERFSELEFFDIRGTLFVEKLIQKTAYVIEDVKIFLEKQYSKWIFTEYSEEVMIIIKHSYEDFDFEKQLINLKTSKKEFDNIFIELILCRFRKEGLTEEIVKSIYLSLEKGTIEEFIDIYVGIYIKYRDLIILNKILLVLNKNSVYKNNLYKGLNEFLRGIELDKVRMDLKKLLIVYNVKERLEIGEVDLTFKILNKIIEEDRERIEELEIENIISSISKYNKEYLEKNLNITRKFALKYKAVMQTYVEIIRKNYWEKREYKISNEDHRICSLYLEKLDKNLDRVVTIISMYIEKFAFEKKEAKLKDFLNQYYYKLNYNYKLDVIEKVSVHSKEKAIELLLEMNLNSTKESYEKIVSIYNNTIGLRERESIIYLSRYLINNNNIDNILIKKILREMMKMDNLDWSEYRYIIKPGLDKLENNESKNNLISIVNEVLERKDVQLNYIEKYLDDAEVLEWNRDKLIQGYLKYDFDSSKIRELAIEKYYLDLTHKEEFINTVFRGEVTEKIIGFIKLNLQKALKEGFEKEYYYLDNVVNSSMLKEYKEFDSLRNHIREFEKARYVKYKLINGKIIYGGYLNDTKVEIIEKKLVEIAKFKDLFTEEEEEFYRVKNIKLEQILFGYYNKKGLEKISQLGFTKYIIENNTFLKGNDIDILENIKEFIQFIKVLEENKFSIRGLNNKLIITTKGIFLKDISEIYEGNLDLQKILISLKLEIINILQNKKIIKILESEMKGNIDDILIIKKMIELLKMNIEKDSLVKVKKYFNYLNDEEQKKMLNRIVIEGNRNKEYLDLVIDNFKCLNKNTEIVKYFLEVLYWSEAKKLSRKKMKDIIKYITEEFEKEKIKDIDINIINRTIRKVGNRDKHIGLKLEEFFL